MRFVPYLNFDGRCAEAFRFYERVLGGRIEMLMTHGESPIAGDVPTEWHDRVMHACLSVGGQQIMASDGPPGQHEKPQGLYVSIHVEGTAEAERIFRELAEGGSTVMPIGETFWSPRFGMCVDRFGTPWMVNCAPVGAAAATA
jgi:PhnB protein